MLLELKIYHTMAISRYKIKVVKRVGFNSRKEIIIATDIICQS
jgi:hypothetical protein